MKLMKLLSIPALMVVLSLATYRNVYIYAYIDKCLVCLVYLTDPNCFSLSYIKASNYFVQLCFLVIFDSGYFFCVFYLFLFEFVILTKSC